MRSIAHHYCLVEQRAESSQESDLVLHLDLDLQMKAVSRVQLKLRAFEECHEVERSQKAAAVMMIAVALCRSYSVAPDWDAAAGAAFAVRRSSSSRAPK